MITRTFRIGMLSAWAPWSNLVCVFLCSTSQPQHRLPIFLCTAAGRSQFGPDGLIMHQVSLNFSWCTGGFKNIDPVSKTVISNWVHFLKCPVFWIVCQITTEKESIPCSLRGTLSTFKPVEVFLLFSRICWSLCGQSLHYSFLHLGAREQEEQTANMGHQSDCFTLRVTQAVSGQQVLLCAIKSTCCHSWQVFQVGSGNRRNISHFTLCLQLGLTLDHP